MKRLSCLAACLLVMFGVVRAHSHWVALNSAATMSQAANEFLDTLSEDQKKKVVMDYDSKQRVDWHFIPKDERKGLQLREMSDDQKKAAMSLLEACLSEAGNRKATAIIQLESVLKELEKDRSGGPLRDSQRYYYTIFGEPGGEEKWGLSIEGHHLSLNFVVKANQVVSTTPSVFCANPADMKSEAAGVPKGTRVLANEEKLAFDLIAALDEDQKKKAIVAEKAPREIRTPGSPQAPGDEKIGISFAELNEDQRQIMRRLAMTYLANWPEDVREAHLEAIVDQGPENVRFAWAGAQEPGVGHYYRMQGPTFLIEFVNTQPDAAGNKANHIHCVWRDMRGDFALPIK